ncbi:MAG: acyltransferase [Reyranella sp.]|uniref:acyltransferase family protein n=1 Tax=Reyranella sp. TaxID=1929291 RepID=UPI0012146877|nr:acyltransferase [Reyranella sp.]TAJ41518.1 MAG: acyltransferase [Reyranella sp.]
MYRKRRGDALPPLAMPLVDRLPCLDGWRAVFCAAVLWSHFVRPGDAYGLLGVRCFFVLSAFLITCTLLSEAARTSGIDFRNYILRRGLRLLPVYVAFLLVLAVTQAWGAADFSAADWMAALTFTQSFLGDSGNEWSSFHLWSLSVELQFYLLWPVFFVLLAPWLSLRRVAIWSVVLVAVAIGFRVAARVVALSVSVDESVLERLFSQVSPFNYLDSLSLGALAACLVFHFRPGLLKLPLWVAAVLAAVGAAMTVLPTEARLAEIPSVALYLTGHTISSVGCALLLVVSVLWPRLWPFRVLNTAPLVLLGTISYSVYIWQQPFTETWLQSHSTEVRLLAALLAGALSYVLLEKPFSLLRTWLRLGARGAAPAVAVPAIGQV